MKCASTSISAISFGALRIKSQMSQHPAVARANRIVAWSSGAPPRPHSRENDSSAARRFLCALSESGAFSMASARSSRAMSRSNSLSNFSLPHSMQARRCSKKRNAGQAAATDHAPIAPAFRMPHQCRNQPVAPEKEERLEEQARHHPARRRVIAKMPANHGEESPPPIETVLLFSQRFLSEIQVTGLRVLYVDHRWIFLLPRRKPPRKDGGARELWDLVATAIRQRAEPG